MKNTNTIYRFAAMHATDDTIKKFDSTLSGLTAEKVENARAIYGTNEIQTEKKETLLEKAIHAFVNPFTLILLLLAAISFFTDVILAAPGEKDPAAVIIILVMVSLSGFITLIQSIQSGNAADKLTSLVKITASVIREEYKQQEVNIDDVVCGDIIHLSAGDMIPADIRLIKTKDLFISQSAMTGESDSVEKFAEIETDETKSVTELQNIAFMGSNVISGTAIGIVIATGNNTMFGNIAKDVSKKKEKTSFDIGINDVSWLLIKFMAVMVPIVFVINGVSTNDWLGAFLFGLSIAVGLTPEMLPMIVASNLIKGANGMAKEGTIIKNLNSIQNFGAIDVLCTDKTGTLTQDKIVLEYHLDVDGDEDDRVLRHAFFNSYYQTGLKNLMDRAIIETADEVLDIPLQNYQKVDEIPFDFQRRRMSVVIKDQNGKTQLITKGAVEEMLSISTYVDYKGEVTKLTDTIRNEVLRKVADLNEDGLRVIAVAQKTNPQEAGEFSIADESDMVLIGYLAFLDPPKDTTAATLEALAEHNVVTKVLTGDNEMITRSVCKQVGIPVDHIIFGNDVDDATDEQLVQIAEDNNVFVKLSPQQKTRIVKALRSHGHVVGFLGDGINDAPAMKAADVGISVDTAVDIAKESADVILLEKDLLILEKGIISGRVVFGNIIKYIKMTASSNFGNIFSVLIAAIFLPFLPMLPIQILALNLIYDFSCISMPWDHVDKEYLYEPKKWDAKSIRRFMVYFGPTSSVFDILMYLLMYFVICPQAFGGQYQTLDADTQTMFIALFHSGWFVMSLWSQTLVTHFLRTPKMPFLQSSASFIVTTITTLGIIIGTIIPFTSIGEHLGMMALPANYFGWLALIIVAYVILVSIVKHIYIKQHKELL